MSRTEKRWKIDQKQRNKKYSIKEIIERGNYQARALESLERITTMCNFVGQSPYRQ